MILSVVHHRQNPFESSCLLLINFLAYSLTLEMEEFLSFEISDKFYLTTRRHIPKIVFL
jgi:hypothetical protein